MGSCISSQLRRAPAPGSTVADVPSPVKNSAVNAADMGRTQFSPSPAKPTVRDYGSKDDVFFDSKAWMDSDCEDDFLSVNGDFTPSCGSTPVHPTLMSTPQARKPPVVIIDKAPSSIPEPSPNTKKKRLAELFRDSIGGSEEAPFAAADYDVDESKPSDDKIASKLPPQQPFTTILDVLPGSGHGTPYIPGANYEPDQEHKLSRPEQQQRCLPSLMSFRLSMSRKKKMPPVHD
ncbi:hypothetical protein SAY86_014581 [Trapa natans]|uniref:Uncharacterized protein n=1 Tax=Trapa natans TaxID=22666 RepID=A0AAN7L0Z4_TRANT|nr:hypothetical protein SAY86_014581 [Trapa natans]